MTATNVPGIEFVDGTPVVPALADVIEGRKADWVAAFGGGINMDGDTSQGMFCEATAQHISQAQGQAAYIMSQFNPARARSQVQDALAEIYGLQRSPGVGTVVAVDCVGLVGSSFPQGSVTLRDGAGYLYSNTAAFVIPPAGTVSVQFQCQTPGPISVGAGELSTIAAAPLGLDSCSNPAPGELGQLQEGDTQFEQKRQDTLAANSAGMLSSVVSAVRAVPGVIDVFAWENQESTDTTYGHTDYPVPANSFVLSVSGGNSSDIAAAMFGRYDGTRSAGNTVVTMYDTNYSAPYPPYEVRFLIPDSIQVYYYVEVNNDPALPTDFIAKAKAAIVAAHNGLDGGDRVRIAGESYSGRFYGGVNAIAPGIVQINQILMGPTAVGAVSSSMRFGVDQRPVTSTANVTVVLT